MSTSRDLIDKSIVLPLNFHPKSNCWATSADERMYLTLERRYGEEKAHILAAHFGFDISRFYPNAPMPQVNPSTSKHAECFPLPSQAYNGWMNGFSQSCNRRNTTRAPLSDSPI